MFMPLVFGSLALCDWPGRGYSLPGTTLACVGRMNIRKFVCNVYSTRLFTHILSVLLYSFPLIITDVNWTSEGKVHVQCTTNHKATHYVLYFGQHSSCFCSHRLGKVHLRTVTCCSTVAFITVEGKTKLGVATLFLETLI